MHDVVAASLQIFTNTTILFRRLSGQSQQLLSQSYPTRHTSLSQLTYVTPQSPDLPTIFHALNLQSHDAFNAEGHCWPDACQHCFQTSTDRRT
jgi:hypothetical protein